MLSLHSSFSRRSAILSIFVFQLMLSFSRRNAVAWVLRCSARGGRAAAISRLYSVQDDVSKRKSKKKFKVVDKITEEHMAKLATAFDELAAKEGFDVEGDTYFADDTSFEEPFQYLQDGSIDPNQFQLHDFVEGDEEDDVLFAEEDMDARVAAAKRSLISPDPNASVKKAKAHLKDLGYRQEMNPYAGDETPRKKDFIIISNSMACSACGSDFQSTNELRPGFLPADKYEIQIKLKRLEEIQNLHEKAMSDEWSPEEEIDWLIQTSGKSASEKSAQKGDIDVVAAAEEMGLNMTELTKKVICKRCHGLQNFGKVEDRLRPGWSEEPLLSQERFRNLLKPLSEKPAVLIALVDLFDISGSILPELDAIAGDNPVILAANKADLLPTEMGLNRVENWVRNELEYRGVKSLANIGGAVRLISCKTGHGVGGMLAKARALADEMSCDIYLVGAANAGKSTLLNRILEHDKDDKEMGKMRAGNQNKRKHEVTTSFLPGTTLKFIEVDIGDGVRLYDTPGLLVNGTLTQLLTADELKMVVPQKYVLFCLTTL
jgi:hypothetical protein